MYMISLVPHFQGKCINKYIFFICSKDKSDQEDEGNDNENDDECDENGERREGAQGPWNVSQGQPSQSQQQQQQPQPQQPVPQAAGDFHMFALLNQKLHSCCIKFNPLKICNFVYLLESGKNFVVKV